MYTAYIGRRLLDLYNTHRRDGPALSPRLFFDEVFFPLMFDDERYLMLANNSKFDQAAKQKKKRPLTEEVRQEALVAFHGDVSTLSKPHGHLYLGGYAGNIEAATSSQISNIEIQVSPDEVYLSWIGTAAGVGVEGGLTILFDNDTLLLSLYDGWFQYRAYMNQLASLKPYQIETWNGWWLVHATHVRFQKTDPLRDFPLSGKDEPKRNSGGQHSYSTPPWIRVIFGALTHYVAGSQICYVYSFGQTNTTIGYIQLEAEELNRLPQFYQKLFGDHDLRDRDNLIALYNTHFGFRTACEHGVIGLRAIEPKDLNKYMRARKSPVKLPKAPKKEQDKITFQIYQTWIFAMLNNEDLLLLSEQTAEALKSFTELADRGKKTHNTLVNDVLGANSSKPFIEALTLILQKESNNKDQFNDLVHQIIKMPAVNVPLFLTLLRFKYAYITAS